MVRNRHYFVAVDAGLSDTQKSRFLSAYRKSFRSKDHTRALKSLYAQFSRRYGVDASLLRQLARQEEAANPKKYAKLRHGLAALQAEMSGARVAKPMSDRSPTGVGRVICAVCGETVPSNQNGTVKLHKATGGNGAVACPGAGRKVLPPQTDDKRPDDRLEPRSIRTSSSGLGSLGKR